MSTLYNFQFSTATDSQVIVGVDVETTGSDAGQMVPMVEQVKGYELVGGRYCTIQAQLAAQLKIRHLQTGRIATLYVTEFSPEFGQHTARIEDDTRAIRRILEP